MIIIESTGNSIVQSNVFNFKRAKHVPAINISNNGDLLVSENTFCIYSTVNEKNTSIVANRAVFDRNSFSGKINEVSNLQVSGNNLFEINSCFFIEIITQSSEINEVLPSSELGKELFSSEGQETSVIVVATSTKELKEYQSSEIHEVAGSSEHDQILYTSSEEETSVIMMKTSTEEPKVYQSSVEVLKSSDHMIFSSEEPVTSTITPEIYQSSYIIQDIATSTFMNELSSNKYFESSTLEMQTPTARNDTHISSERINLVDSSEFLIPITIIKIISSIEENGQKSEKMSHKLSSEYNNITESQISGNIIIDNEKKSNLPTIIASVVVVIVVVIIVVVIIVIIVVIVLVNRRKINQDTGEIDTESELETVDSATYGSEFLITQGIGTFISPFTQAAANNDDDPFKDDYGFEERNVFML